MKIKDVKANTGKIDLTAEVVSKEEPRTFEKFGKSGQVCNAKLKDASGEIKFTLWNEDIEKVSVGDKIKLENGWCSEFKGEKQLSTGKFGKLEIVDASTKAASGKSPKVGKEKEVTEVLSNDPNFINQGDALAEDDVEAEAEEEVVDEEEEVF